MIGDRTTPIAGTVCPEVVSASLQSSDRSAGAVRSVFGDLGRRSVLRRRSASSDAALVRSARRGSESALEELFRRHWAGLYRAAYLVAGDRAAAEDIAQEAFLAAVRALASFDRRRPLAPWLQRIAVNRAIDFTRARSLRREVDPAALPEPQERPSREVLDCSPELLAALERLTPEHRAVIVMRYVLDRTPGEIAHALGLPRGTVNSRLRRGLDGLADDLGEPPG